MCVYIGWRGRSHSVWSQKSAAQIKRGDELGYFAYGGSTVVAIFPPKLIEFDQDLLDNSCGKSAAAAGEGGIETLVKVGLSLGRMPTV